MSPVGKPVHIKLQKKTNGTWKLTIDPMDGWIKRAGQEIVWDSEGADIRIDFGGAGPFTQNTFMVPEGGSASSGVNQKAPQAKYHYSMTLTPNPPIPLRTHGNMPPITIDPDVVVDDNGPPPKARRRGAAKKRASRRGSSRRAGRKPR